MAKLVLTLMANDRPGLVKAVSDLVVDNGGNWLQSRMANLAGTFTGLILIEVADASKDALSRALQDFAQGDITITLREADSEGPGAPDSGFTVEIVGADHPGIVNEIAERLVQRNVNITRMKTDHEPAAMSGQPMFSARIAASLPAGVERDALQADLEQAAEELMVEISFA